MTDIEKGEADISSGDYVTYMDDELQSNSHLEIIGEASILQPNQLALFVKAGSKISNLGQLEGKKVSVAGHDDIATLLIDSLLSDNGVPPSKVILIPGTPLPAPPGDPAAPSCPSPARRAPPAPGSPPPGPPRPVRPARSIRRADPSAARHVLACDGV